MKSRKLRLKTFIMDLVFFLMKFDFIDGIQFKVL